MNVCENMSKGQLIFVGLGLYDEDDISLKGLNEIRNCDKVFAEFYTSRLVGLDKNSFEKKLGKTIEILSREETEKGNKILEYASKEKVVFLTCGDPMIATTHVDLRLRAMKKGMVFYVETYLGSLKVEGIDEHGSWAMTGRDFSQRSWAICSTDVDRWFAQTL